MKDHSVEDEVGKKKTILLLFLIIVVGFLTRSYFWFNGFSGFNVTEPGGMYAHSVLDFAADILTLLDSSNDKSFIYIHGIDKSEFISRIMYPLWLTPIYIFGLHESTYVFWLHHFFVAFTIIFIFLSARQIGGPNAGLLGAFVYASHFHVAYWFNWINFLEPFHFQISLFMCCSLLCWKRASRKNMFLLALSGAMVCCTRPDGFAYVVVSFLVLAYSLTAPRFGATRVIAVLLGTILVFLLSGAYVLTQSKVAREKVFSIIHVSRLLYWGSEETPTEARAFDALIHRQSHYCSLREATDPKGRSGYYLCSVEGLKRIKSDPLKYMLVLVKRSAHVIFPSFTREGVSWKYKIVARTIMSFILIGMICGFIFHNNQKFEMTGLTLMALAIYSIVIFIESNWLPRVQLSAHVMLITGASCGWIMLVNLAYEKFRFIRKTAPVEIER